MNQTKIGTLIAQCRKEQKLTQAQLAEKLNITDRAVSKWETGKSMPDSSIMLELCSILGITVNELLSGEKLEPDHSDHYEKMAEENLLALKRKEENNMSKKKIAASLFTLLLFLAIVVCLTCDLAISGNLTWSLIPISSIAFAWAVLFPSILLGKSGMITSLISLSAFILPYLYLLRSLLKIHAVFSIGAAMAIPAVVFLWLAYAVFVRIGKKRKWMALGITFTAAVPLVFVINLILAKLIGEPVLDMWDLLTVFILVLLAFGSFVGEYYKRRGK